MGQLRGADLSEDAHSSVSDVLSEAVLVLAYHCTAPRLQRGDRFVGEIGEMTQRQDRVLRMPPLGRGFEAVLCVGSFIGVGGAGLGDVRDLGGSLPG